MMRLNSMIQRPIVMGPLVGLVLGDVNAGLAVGATLELAFMGNVTIGAALPPEIRRPVCLFSGN